MSKEPGELLWETNAQAVGGASAWTKWLDLPTETKQQLAYIESAIRADEIAKERERCAKVAESYKKSERELVQDARWVEVSDDFGKPVGSIREVAAYTLDYRKGIAAAIRAQE